ncbi:MAG: hypothetical protein FJW39_07985 [Acidobacteria bacterium]|nr:hypothetical protein [Acidobacteriota bacterium]
MNATSTPVDSVNAVEPAVSAFLAAVRDFGPDACAKLLGVPVSQVNRWSQGYVGSDDEIKRVLQEIDQAAVARLRSGSKGQAALAELTALGQELGI